MNPIYDFSGSVALVTGASSGIGLATATAFAQNGAAVVLADVNESLLDQATNTLMEAGHTAIAVLCDVADETQVASMIKRAISTFGRLDMAFNNAGIAGHSGTLTAEATQSFDRLNAINLRGVWVCMKHELIRMSAQGHGAIVNCSSLGGLVGQSGRASYHATKHGVIGLTKSAGVEYAARGIRVNAVCPGVVETPMFTDLLKRSPQAMEAVKRDQPIERLGQPEEIAAAVLWLCSPASSFVVGAALPVDGGFTAH